MPGNRRVEIRHIFLGFSLTVCVVGLSGCEGRRTVGAPTLEVKQTASQIIVEAHGKPIVIYQVTAAWKPYVKEFRNTAGINVVRDGPSDHLHHHGVMFALRVDGVNFWEEQAQSGRQEHREWLPVAQGVAAGVNYVSFGHILAWTRPGDSAPLLEETRRLTIFKAEDLGASLMDWSSRLTAPRDREGVVLSGPKYVGLGVRFAKSMDSGGKFRNAKGESGVRGTDGAEAAWTAYSGPVSWRRTATVAVFGDPNNPPLWFTLDEPFAYLSATLGLERRPLRLSKGERLELRYGLAVWDGSPESTRIQAVYERWQALVQTLTP